MMPIIALSVTEAELYAAVLCAQDMLFIMRLLFSLGMDVQLPMILEVDNKGAVDFINGWSLSGRTRHIKVKQYFLRELKEQGIINSFQAIAPLTGQEKGYFLKGRFSLKNWTQKVILRHSTNPFKSTCFLIYLKEVPFALYGPYFHC
jgi:hypothetical protein